MTASRAAYLRNWRAAYPHKVKEYNERQRRKAGREPRAVAPVPSPAERKRAYDRAYSRERHKRLALGACAFCALGPCSGRCEREG